MDGTILIADDDRTIRTVLTQALTRAGCRVRATGNTTTLWRWIEEGEGDAVISDVMMPDGNGLDMLPAIRRRRPDLPVIVISAQNTVMTAIKASEAGAYDYLPKPFDLRDLLSKVNKALSHAERPKVSPEAQESENALPLIGGSPAMQEVYRIFARVLNTDLNVMILGESGTGKDLLAKTLHQLGGRSGSDFVTFNAATLDKDELTDTLISRASLAGGTVYLDELGEMTPECQISLLGLLQNPAVMARNLRFVSSSSQPIGELVNEGVFREDLFYRLNVMPINLPPLRDRTIDIADLSHFFLQKHCVEGSPVKTISPEALEKLRLNAWPGNVRALENFVRQMVVLCPEDEITSAFVSERIRQIPAAEPNSHNLSGDRLSATVGAHIQRYFDQHGDALPPPGLYNRILREVELPLIALTLSATRGNQIKAAELLGINRNTLRKKIGDLDISVTRGRKMM
ncbi:MAG: response regulator [Rhodobacteraceae bacterium]|nr:response regulator [Paracoccaceae bacterium]